MKVPLLTLPEGTVRVALGLAVLGVASYVHLAIAGHTLSAAQMADLSVVWSLAYSVGLGLFYPVEQEVTRTTAARRVAGLALGPVLWRGLRLSAILLGAVVVALTLGAPVLAGRLFGGEPVLVFVTAAAIAALAACSPVRGATAGGARFDLYGRQLGIDGALRIGLAALLGVAGLASAALFGLVLAVAPIVATFAVVGPIRRGLVPGEATRPAPASSWGELGHGTGPLIVSMLLGQFALTSAVVGARLVAPDQPALAAALLSALVLIRVPVFVFTAIQASLLTGLAAAAALGQTEGFRRMVRHGCAVVTALMAVAAVPAIAFGPWLIRTLFAAPDVLGHLDFAILTAGTLAYLLSLVLGQASISLHHHRDQMLAWVAGAVVLVGVTLTPLPVGPRVELAYAATTWVVTACLAVALFRRRDSPQRVPAPLADDRVPD